MTALTALEAGGASPSPTARRGERRRGAGRSRARRFRRFAPIRASRRVRWRGRSGGRDSRACRRGIRGRDPSRCRFAGFGIGSGRGARGLGRGGGFGSARGRRGAGAPGGPVWNSGGSGRRSGRTCSRASGPAGTVSRTQPPGTASEQARGRRPVSSSTCSTTSKRPTRSKLRAKGGRSPGASTSRVAPRRRASERSFTLGSRPIGAEETCESSDQDLAVPAAEVQDPRSADARPGRRARPRRSRSAGA